MRTDTTSSISGRKSIAADRKGLNPDGRSFSIGELAGEFGVTQRTLRFYEDRGLITPQRFGKARRYDDMSRARLALILKGKRLGFTLAEIRQLLGAKESVSSAELRLSRRQIADQIAHLERQKSEIDEAITALKATYSRIAGPESADAATHRADACRAQAR